MKSKITLFIATAATVAIALIAAGCGSSSSGGANSSGPYGSAATASPPATEEAKVAVADSPLGPILVDGGGRTLYLFQKDTSTTSTCEGDCASFWPPLATTSKPLAGDGVLAGKLGTTERTDGKTEVTYNGHPLYYYAGDKKAGDTTGQGLDLFGAEWNVLSPAGKEIESDG